MNAKTTVKTALLIVLAIGLVATTGCKHKTPISTTPSDTGAIAQAPTSGDGLPGAELDKLLWDKATGLQIVYFDFDSFALRADAKATLAQNAEKIKQAVQIAPAVMIQIEGHCDERGTQEYNLALGEKRALAVRDYLISLGASGDRMLTISYGEENPVDPGHGEAAWAKNRRSEFNKSR